MYVCTGLGSVLWKLSFLHNCINNILFHCYWKEKVKNCDNVFPFKSNTTPKYYNSVRCWCSHSVFSTFQPLDIVKHESLATMKIQLRLYYFFFLWLSHTITLNTFKSGWIPPHCFSFAIKLNAVFPVDDVYENSFKTLSFFRACAHSENVFTYKILCAQNKDKCLWHPKIQVRCYFTVKWKANIEFDKLKRWRLPEK